MNKKTATIIVITIIAALVGMMVWGIAMGMQHGWGCKGSSIGGTRLSEEAVVRQKVQPTYRDVERITMDFVSENIEVISTKEDVVRVEQTSNVTLPEKDLMRAGMKGGELILTSGRGGWNFFACGGQAQSTVTVYLPETANIPVELSTQSGIIRVTGGNYKKLSVETVSGKIKGEGIEVQKELSADSMSGEIQFLALSCGFLSVESTSGTVEIAGNVAGKLDLSGTSGDIRFEGNAEKVTADSVSGKIGLVLGTAKSINANTTSGEIAVSCEDTAQTEKISADTISGNVSLVLPESGGFTVDYETLSGDFESEFEMTAMRYGDGAVDIEVGTTSGALELVKRTQ